MNGAIRVTCAPASAKRCAAASTAAATSGSVGMPHPASVCTATRRPLTEKSGTR